MLSELVDFKPIYQELASQRCCQLYKEYLENETSESSKVNTYILLSNIVQRYSTHENYKKRINITSFQEGVEDLMEDEDVLEFQDNKVSDFLLLIKDAVSINAVKELAISELDQSNKNYATTYGLCQRPFGILRARVVEFLSQIYSNFPKEAHAIFLEKDLYNTLLHYFELYPFHNILHQKVHEIFMNCFEKNSDDISRVLETDLVKKILDIAKDKVQYEFESQRKMSQGYNAFLRKLANKLVEIQTKDSEASNFFEAIPEWKQYVEGDLTEINTLESRPLAQDPRKKNNNQEDYDIELYFQEKSNVFGSNSKFGKPKPSSDNQIESKKEDDDDAEEEDDGSDENGDVIDKTKDAIQKILGGQYSPLDEDDNQNNDQ